MPVKFPSRPITGNAPNSAPKTSPPGTGHQSDAVRADLGKLEPSQRAEILRSPIRSEELNDHKFIRLR
jgi:hypothetical protein